MSAPDWLCWIFAIAMIAVALFHLVRLAGPRVLGGRARPDVEITHAAAGLAMTLMLLGRLTAWDSRALIAIFAVPMVWFAVRGTHAYIMNGNAGVVASVQLVTGCAAMTYMLTIPARSATHSGMAGMSMAAAPGGAGALHSGPLGTLLVAVTAGLAVWTVHRLRRTPVPGAAGCSAATAGSVVAGATACQLAMNVTTVFMLVAM